MSIRNIASKKQLPAEERGDLIGHKTGKIISLLASANKEGGKKAIIDFGGKTGEVISYLSGRAIRSKKLKVGSVAEFSAFAMSDGSFSFRLKGLDLDTLRKEFVK